MKAKVSIKAHGMDALCRNISYSSLSLISRTLYFKHTMRFCKLTVVAGFGAAAANFVCDAPSASAEAFEVHQQRTRLGRQDGGNGDDINVDLYVHLVSASQLSHK